MTPMTVAGGVWALLAWIIPAFDPIPRMSFLSIVGPLALLVAGISLAVRRLSTADAEGGMDAPFARRPSKTVAVICIVVATLLALMLVSTYLELRARGET